MTDIGPGTPFKLDGTPRKASLKQGETEWTEERVKTLKAMWANGASQNDVAVALDMSRGSVAGKLSRLGLGNRGFHAVKGQPRKRRAFRPSVEGALKAEPLPEPILDVPSHQRVRLLDLRPKQCRFFCGEVGQPDAGFCPEKAVDGRSWCAGHARLVFAGPRQPFTGPRPGRIMRGMAL